MDVSSRERQFSRRERLLSAVLSKILKRQLDPVVFDALGELRVGFVRLRKRDNAAQKEDLEMKSLQGAGAPSDRKVWAGFAMQSAQPKALDEKVSESDSRAAQQARVRLGNLIVRRLDMFQNRTQFRWARLNQGASIIVGAALSAYALIPAGTMEGKDAFAGFALSLMAGMLAPFAKDVVTAVSGIRAKA